MESLKIILLSVLAAVVYGILHDQVTTRICVEYFTIGHPPVFNTDNPTWLAFGWGTIATWWVGFILGIPLALVSRLGSWPKFNAAHLLRPIISCTTLLARIARIMRLRSLLRFDCRAILCSAPTIWNSGFALQETVEPA